VYSVLYLAPDIACQARCAVGYHRGASLLCRNAPLEPPGDLGVEASPVPLRGVDERAAQLLRDP
jgi:hypothetical protein